MLFNGANIAEKINISSNGARVTFSRDIASVVMDLNKVENINFNALAGADSISVGDLSGTDTTALNLNLASIIAGGAGDGAADTVTVFGTAGDDVALVVGDAAGIQVIGLPSLVTITGAEGANDRLIINTLAGDDVIEASGLAAGAIQFTGDADAGNDVLIGSPGADTLLGGDGDDVLIGNGGQDVLDGGNGDNVVIP